MKLLTFTLFVMLFRQAAAQDTGRVRLVISLSGGAYMPRNAGKNVVESFPYTSTPTGTGVASGHVFLGSLGGNFSKVGYVGDIMNFEVTSKGHAINGGIGLFQDASSDDGGYFKAGYRRVWRLYRNRFWIMPGVDLYGVLGSPMELGKIDNKNQTLQLLSHTVNPQWTETKTTSTGTHTYTYNADYLAVLYHRDGLLAEPKIVVSTTRKRLVLGLEAGWMFQLIQGCALILQQQDGGNENRNTVAKIHEPRNGSMSGFYTALRIGMVNRSTQIFGGR
ncbi:MAG TPA: hypothetical protein VNV35_06710 [Puia sp.]|jgi:hypothetical protein|nr:hypothetical protein [Puia sp.]